MFLYYLLTQPSVTDTVHVDTKQGEGKTHRIETDRQMDVYKICYYLIEPLYKGTHCTAL